MRRNRKHLAFVLISTVIILTSCKIGQNFYYFSENKFQPTNPDSMAVFASQIPNRPYTEIGLARVRVFNGNRFENTRKLRKVAGEWGADALINVSFDYIYVSGVAIKWK